MTLKKVKDNEKVKQAVCLLNAHDIIFLILVIIP